MFLASNPATPKVEDLKYLEGFGNVSSWAMAMGDPLCSHNPKSTAIDLDELSMPKASYLEPWQPLEVQFLEVARQQETHPLLLQWKPSVLSCVGLKIPDPPAYHGADALPFPHTDSSAADAPLEISNFEKFPKFQILPVPSPTRP